MCQLKHNFYTAGDALVVVCLPTLVIGESPFHLVNQLIRVPDSSRMFSRFSARALSILQLSRFEGLKSCLFFHSYRIPEWRGKVNECFYSSLLGSTPVSGSTSNESGDGLSGVVPLSFPPLF